MAIHAYYFELEVIRRFIYVRMHFNILKHTGRLIIILNNTKIDLLNETVDRNLLI